jgi:hypothetical protein
MSKSTGGLGFRDFVTFNNALLAKQLCRLLQHPDSLATHIIQAKYHPYTSILEATVGVWGPRRCHKIDYLGGGREWS